MPLSEVFIDSAYVIALSNPNDQHHRQAEALAEQLEAEGTRLITTRAVALEIRNALSRLRHRAAAVELLDALEQDPSVEIVPLSEQPVRTSL